MNYSLFAIDAFNKLAFLPLQHILSSNTHYTFFTTQSFCDTTNMLYVYCIGHLTHLCWHCFIIWEYRSTCIKNVSKYLEHKILIIVLVISLNIHVCSGTQKSLIKMVLLSTHNIIFIEK